MRNSSKARQPPMCIKKNRDRNLKIADEIFYLTLLIVLGLFALEMLVKV